MLKETRYFRHYYKRARSVLANHGFDILWFISWATLYFINPEFRCLKNPIFCDIIKRARSVKYLANHRFYIRWSYFALHPFLNWAALFFINPEVWC